MHRPAFLRRSNPLPQLVERLRRPKTRALRSHPRIEPLETRYAPATFAGTGGAVLNIFLDHAGEAISISAAAGTYNVSSTFAAVDGGNPGGDVSGFGTTTASIQAAAFQAIHVTDSATGTSVTFQTSVSAYSSAFDIVLDDPTAGGLSFA